MPKTRRFFHAEKDSDEDDFETEALAPLNKPREDEKHDSESDEELQDSSDLDDNSEDEGGFLEEDVNSEDDEDDSPEAVGFSASKAATLSQLKQAMKQIDSQKQKKKEQRQHQEQQFKEQKAKKLEELNKARLPDDFLNELSGPVTKETKKRKKAQQFDTSPNKDDKAGNENTSNTPKITHFDDEMESEDNEYIPFEKKQKKKTQKRNTPEVIRRGGISIVNVDAVSRLAIKSLSQSAATFRQGRLYNKQTRRESTQKREAKAIKRKARFL